jgi:stage II sporulation protein GA (sporulation sigma-E factor processing peptidase)
VYVYADILIVLNLLMNTVIFWGTGLIVGIRPRWGRILGGAFVGALVSVIMLLPIGSFLRWSTIKVLVSILMVGIVFYPIAWRRLPFILAVFYLMSFMLGGTALALLYFMDASTYLTNGIFIMQHASWITVISAVVLMGCIGYWAWGRLSTRLWQKQYYIPVRIWFSGRSEQVLALMDSGNCLRDPISRTPVMVVEYARIKSLLPAEVCRVLNTTAEDNWLDVVSEMPDEWVARLHIIPFSSIGKKRGLLIGFRPDYVEVEENGATKQNAAVIVGICNRNLSRQGEYHALLHPELVHRAETNN